MRAADWPLNQFYEGRSDCSIRADGMAVVRY